MREGRKRDGEDDREARLQAETQMTCSVTISLTTHCGLNGLRELDFVDVVDDLGREAGCDGQSVLCERRGGGGVDGEREVKV